MKLLFNIGWGVFGNSIKHLINAVAIIYIVRNSLSEEFGALSIALIYLVVGKAIASVGTQPIALRYLYKYKKTDRIINSIFRLQLIASITLLLLGASILYVMNEEGSISNLYLIISVGVIFQPAFSFSYYLESRLKQKQITVANIWGSSVGFIFKVVAIGYFHSIELVVIGFLIEQLITSILYYKFTGFDIKSILTAKFTINYKLILFQSWPYLIGILSVLIYSYTDMLMIDYFLGKPEVAVYSVAAKMNEFWILIPTIVISTISPRLFKIKEKESKEYYNNSFHQGIMIVTSLCFLWFLFNVLFGEYFVTLIFGVRYIESGELAPVFAFMSIFFAFGIISSKWFLFEGLQVLAMRRNILGAILNGIINLYLIPRFGVEGAAYGTLISLVFTNYLYDALSYRTRDLFYMKSKWFLFSNTKSNFDLLKEDYTIEKHTDEVN